MSEMVKVTRLKLESLSSAIRSKLGTDATKLTLSEMIADIPELTKPKTDVQPGTYDANGNMLKSWAKVIEDGDLVIDDEFYSDPYLTMNYWEGDDTATRFANVSKVVIGPGVVGLHSNLFTNCTNIVEVVIPDGVKYIGVSGYFDSGVFAGCSSLTTVRIPNSVEEIFVPAFANCTSLTEITIPNSVTYIEGEIFYGCTNLTTIHYSGTETGAPWGATNATVVP